MIKKCGKCGKEFKCININLGDSKHPCDICNGVKTENVCPLHKKREYSCFDIKQVKEMINRQSIRSKIGNRSVIEIAEEELSLKDKEDLKEEYELTELKSEV